MPRPGAKFSNASSPMAAIEIDSNIVERAIRPQTITRKNALFAGSDGGGRTWATIATLLQIAKMNDVDPLTWLAQTLQRIANGWPNLPDRKTHAVEPQGLNGLSLALTLYPSTAAASRSCSEP
jgi:hypothetical protein